jgi:hypothetical protein
MWSWNCPGIQLGRLGKTAYIHTYIHIFVPWIRKCVIKTVGCGTSHKYIYTN